MQHVSDYWLGEVLGRDTDFLKLEKLGNRSSGEGWLNEFLIRLKSEMIDFLNEFGFQCCQTEAFNFKSLTQGH